MWKNELSIHLFHAKCCICYDFYIINSWPHVCKPRGKNLAAETPRTEPM